MKKKIVALMLTALMAVSMVACGSSEAEEVAEDEAAAPAADGELISVGFAQVGHESDWRTASTNSVQAAFTAENGYDLQFVDCDNDSEAQINAVRQFIQNDVDYIVIDAEENKELVEKRIQNLRIIFE